VFFLLLILNFTGCKSVVKEPRVEKPGVLYLYESSSGFVLKSFGDAKVQPKYKGGITNGEPNGFGVLTYPYSEKIVIGEWKNGKEWNTKHTKKDGTLIGKFVNGEWIGSWGVLFGRHKNSKLVYYNDGDDRDVKYIGGIKDGRPNGQGTETYHDGGTYVGEWKDGKPWNGTGYDKYENIIGKFVDGKGKQVVVEEKEKGVLYSLSVNGEWGWYKSGDEKKDGKYVGEIENGIPDGQGTETWYDEWNYIGKYKDGKQYGQGSFTYPDGRKYEGQWKNGKRNGHGTEISPDGRKYVGEWKNGKQYGQGSYYYPSGEKYAGEWKNGKQYGQGTETFPDGRKYVGKYKDGKQYGQGSFTYPDGRKYVGKYKDGKRNGHGTEISLDGRKYVGQWKDGEQNGPGITTYPDGRKYVGEYKDGKRNGHGTEISLDGRKYVGKYKDGKRNGHGTEISLDGRKYVGKYKDEKRNGQGSYYYPSGEKYAGEWKNGNPWNITGYDKNGNIIGKIVNGEQQ
jgi:hypothetical protein